MLNNSLTVSLDEWYKELTQTWFLIGNPELHQRYRNVLAEIAACNSLTELEQAQGKFKAMHTERAARPHRNFNLSYGIGALVGASSSAWMSYSNGDDATRVVKCTLFGAALGGIAGASLSTSVQPRVARQVEPAMFNQISAAFQTRSESLQSVNNTGLNAGY